MFPGHGSRIRNVKVKTRAGEYKRPITKIGVVNPAKGFEDNPQEDEDYALIMVESVLMKTFALCDTCVRFYH